MKTLLPAAALCLVSVTAALAADPDEGTWRSEANDEGAYIEVSIAECGPAICGTITNVVGGDTSIAGKPIIWDMKANGNGKYRKGRIWAPDEDKTYRSKMDLSGNALKVSGCVGPICRGQTWMRVQ